MSGSPISFANAPFTKIILAGTVCSSLILQIAHITRGRVPFLVTLFAKAFVFQNPSELLFGAMLVYYSRNFERLFGVAKYGAFVGVAGVIAKVLEMAAGRFFGLAARTGPFAVAFSNLVNFLLDVPATQRFSLLGIQMTDKVFIYVAYLQLCLSSGRSGMLSALCGFTGGCLYRLNVLGVSCWRVAPLLLQLVDPLGSSRPFTPMMTGAGAASRAPAGPPGVPGGPPAAPGTGVAQTAGPAAAVGGVPPVPAVSVSQDAVEQLVAMGFDRSSATEALQQTRNDVQAALSLLL